MTVEQNKAVATRFFCELSVLGARELLAVVLSNISEVRIYQSSFSIA